MVTTPFVKGSMLFSTKDHPGHFSTICFVDVTKCNLSCFDCHNKYACKKNYKNDFYSFTEFGEIFQNSIDMGTADVLIISGGEPTLFTNEVFDVVILLKEKYPGIKIRIDTNGQLPSSVEKLKPIVDGFAVDIKIPIKDRYSTEDKEKFSEILGINSIKRYKENVLETITLVDEMEYSLFRTVRYRQLSEKDVNRINDFVENLKSPHYWNEFVDGDYI